MKKHIHYIAFLCVSLLLFSCKQQEVKLPPPISTVAEAQNLITGKTWQVIDVATISGSRKSVFDDDKTKSETVTVPAPDALNWLSKIKGIDTATDFIGSFYKENFIKFKKISMTFSKDSIATTTGLDAENQTFSITNTVVEKEPNGLKLYLKGDMKGFSDMFTGKTTMTFYILGADQNTLFLLTPNQMNDLKVVFLLKSK